jgi:MFS transporter, ACDE family, multidrug resistance protein
LTATQHAPAGSPLRQPKAVWAVAFACVISFMGIGLVDPILPSLSSQLHASPSQVELLFTSYLVVTAVAMLVTGWVSSRIGAKRTLICGLVLIVICAALAGSAGSIGGIIGFRAGWGLGNALFIATSLAVIVASASGGFAGAIILYEAALGLGIAVGPLLGGELGGISWRGPFFGVSALMAIALIATIVMVAPTPKPARRTSITEPLKALRHRGLLTMSLTALCYNWGFFTLLGYAPFPMHLGAHQLGYVFTAWGVLVALFSVAVAPRLQRRFGTAPTLYVNLFGLAVVLGVIGARVSSSTTIVVAVIVAGTFIGINNTLTTQAVMSVAPVERPVASASYGFVRFIGGGLAPYVAGRLAERYNEHLPFYLGSAAFLLAIVVLATGHRILAAVDRPEAVVQTEVAQPAVGELLYVGATAGDRFDRPVVVAVDDGPAAEVVTSAAAQLANALHAPLELLHVQEIEVVGDDAVEGEDLDRARETVRARLAELGQLGVPATGHVLRSVNDHGNVGRLIARHANSVGATMVAVGSPSHGPLAALIDRSASRQLIADVHCNVLLVHPNGTESGGAHQHADSGATAN